MKTKKLNKLIKKEVENQLITYGMCKRLEKTTCTKAEHLLIEIRKELLLELFNFAHQQAEKTGTLNELNEIDARMNTL
jgi:hypothetical protein|tara:strand:- start:225 stop:458 length:234 start_codon:yes stop_codon:yes gene_type:complete